MSHKSKRTSITPTKTKRASIVALPTTKPKDPSVFQIIVSFFTSY